MDLNDAQIEAFKRDGFLLIERVFSASEMEVLRAAIPEFTEASRAKPSPDGKAHPVHGAHLHSEVFRRLSFHPRLVRPVQRLAGAEVHVYQARVQMKAGLDSAWEGGYAWHQDYSTWWMMDGMQEPRPIVIFVHLDDVTACNGPILVIPGSHKNGLIGERPPPGEDQYMVVKPDTVRELAGRGGVIPLLGPAGTVVFMQSATVHGSTANISPMRRAIFGVVFNPIDNVPKHPRSGHFVSRAEPVRPLADDCLLALGSPDHA
jgi:ectoine hydroxylase